MDPQYWEAVILPLIPQAAFVLVCVVTLIHWVLRPVP